MKRPRYRRAEFAAAGIGAVARDLLSRGFAHADVADALSRVASDVFADQVKRATPAKPALAAPEEPQP